MKDLKIVTPIKVAKYAELGARERELVDAAREATDRSYAPYSHFHVGAAVRLEDGPVLTGSNQENAAFPSSLCAERTAAYYAHSRYPDKPFEMIAVSARGTDGRQTKSPIPPCGACRQALLEYETLAGHDVPVILDGAEDIYILPSVASLLPIKFDSF